jgi:hypothetical protein
MPGNIKSSTITAGGFCVSIASVKPCSPVEATRAEKPAVLEIEANTLSDVGIVFND